MKSVIATISTILLTQSAFAAICANNEAQFIGTVVENRTVRYDQGVADCMVKIEFRSFQSSYVCPLDEADVQGREVLAASDRCEGTYDVGSEISGILLQGMNGELVIE